MLPSVSVGSLQKARFCLRSPLQGRRSTEVHRGPEMSTVVHCTCTCTLYLYLCPMALCVFKRDHLMLPLVPLLSTCACANKKQSNNTNTKQTTSTRTQVAIAARDQQQGGAHGILNLEIVSANWAQDLVNWETLGRRSTEAQRGPQWCTGRCCRAFLSALFKKRDFV